MFSFLIILFFLVLGKPLALIGAGVASWAAIQLWRRWDEPRRRRRYGWVLLATGMLVGAPVTAIKIKEHRFVLARVPEPLRVATIEYRREEDWGSIGLPGDNETGFVVYRLTSDSAQWARDQGPRLPDRLSLRNATWQATPVHDDDRGWRPHRGGRPPRPMIAAYLDRYGFGIDVRGHDGKADLAVQAPGSFYTYGRGGSITIVDPRRGKVYFAYAG